MPGTLPPEKKLSLQCAIIFAMLIGTTVFDSYANSDSADNSAQERSVAEILSDYQTVMDISEESASAFSWSANCMLSNEGSKQDTRWQEQLTLFGSQTEGVSKSVFLSYTTSGFSGKNDLLFSIEHEIPAWRSSYREWFWQFETALQRYDAAEFDADSRFFSETWYLKSGLENSWYPNNKLRISTGIGLQMESIEQESEFYVYRQALMRLDLTLVTTDEDLLVPNIYLAALHLGDHSESSLYIELTKNINDLDPLATQKLGRLDTKTDYRLLNYQLQHTQELTPRAQRRHNAKSHSITLEINGQYGFEDRLIPQLQYGLGGANSVRGYEEQLISADEMVSARLNYDLDNLLAGNTSHQHKLRLFVDAARAVNFAGVAHIPEWGLNNEPVVGSSHRLFSIGAGWHYRFRETFFVKLEAGMALKDVTITSENILIMSSGLRYSSEETTVAEQGDKAVHLELRLSF